MCRRAARQKHGFWAPTTRAIAPRWRSPPDRNRLSPEKAECPIIAPIRSGASVDLRLSAANRRMPAPVWKKRLIYWAFAAFSGESLLQLSGGERQRVAIARAVATEPKIMLFDEPLAALDFKRKSEIMPWLEKLKTNLKIPMLYVTHSAEEVLHLADNLIVMEDGRIETSGSFDLMFLPVSICRSKSVRIQVFS